jgi:uncharacterized damage-inducible protein DinB
MRQDQPSMTQSTRAFVVLHHEIPVAAGPPSHWDLMIEANGSLVTWRLPHDWSNSTAQIVERIPDHRLDFLEWEGELDGNRGSVAQVDRGQIVVHAWSDAEISGFLCGREGETLFRIARIVEATELNQWRLESRQYRPTGQNDAMTIRRQPWFERQFPHGLQGHLLPIVTERLRGTPARIADRLARVPHALLVRKKAPSWSIQENVGHLSDVEPLWAARIADLLSHRDQFLAADLTNRATQEADHNRANLADLIERFRSLRTDLVRQLELFPPELVSKTAMHPRLKQAMNVVDLAHFIAEHDDYHLAKISELLRIDA